MHAVDTVDSALGKGRTQKDPPPPRWELRVQCVQQAEQPGPGHRAGWCRNWAPGSDHRLSEAALSAVHEKLFRRLSQKPNNIPRKHRVTKRLQPGVQRPGRGQAGQGTAGERSGAQAVVLCTQDLGAGARQGPAPGEGDPHWAQTPHCRRTRPAGGRRKGDRTGWTEGSAEQSRRGREVAVEALTPCRHKAGLLGFLNPATEQKKKFLQAHILITSKLEALFTLTVGWKRRQEIH